jgi:Ca2+:H+ antiporter
MIPAANLLGFAGQEFGRKLPHVFGVLVETTFGSVVEIILFMVLVSRGEEFIPVIKAAILGSILANLLLCLGFCFFAGGLRRDEQVFHEAVSEVGGNLMLVAGSKSWNRGQLHISMLTAHSGLDCSGRLQYRPEC